MRSFQVSVVMAAYNTELFLAEAIESLLHQDIGFRENIELILVDDGSTDGTGNIRDMYGAKYPENILVIHKENGGVASAKNEGIKHATGKYVNFMDSDDKLSEHTIGAVVAFFSAHEGEVDLVSVPMVFFDGAHHDHILNYKYEHGSRVVDLEKEYDHIQLSISSSFVLREKMKGISFDPQLAFGEDAKLCVQLLLEKQALGVVSNGKYLYRKRSQGEKSALQQSWELRSWYLPTLQNFSVEVFRIAKEKLGYVPRFVQFTVMYSKRRNKLQIIQ